MPSVVTWCWLTSSRWSASPSCHNRTRSEGAAARSKGWSTASRAAARAPAKGSGKARRSVVSSREGRRRLDHHLGQAELAGGEAAAQGIVAEFTSFSKARPRAAADGGFRAAAKRPGVAY